MNPNKLEDILSILGMFTKHANRADTPENHAKILRLAQRILKRQQSGRPGAARALQKIEDTEMNEYFGREGNLDDEYDWLWEEMGVDRLDPDVPF